MTHCCGTCKFWCPEGAGDFRERCKARFREPFCKLTNKVQYADDMLGCLIWKQAEDAELKRREKLVV